MKKEEIQRVLKDIVLDVFENMWFLFPEAITEGDPAPGLSGPCFKAEVVLKNGAEAFVLYGSEQLVKDMAKNFLGTDQPIAEADLVDVFKEAANVLAGNLVTRLSLNSGLDPGIPVAERLQDCPEFRTPPEDREIIFNIDGQCLRVVVVTSND